MTRAALGGDGRGRRCVCAAALLRRVGAVRAGARLLATVGSLALFAQPLIAAEASEPSQRIALLEADGRAHPRAAADALERLLPSTPEGSAERLELLTVEGVTLAVASMDDDAVRIARRLDDWSHDAASPRAGLAGAAALLIRARMLIRGGELPQAEALLRTAVARLPTDLRVVDRYRFVFAQGYVASEAGRLEDAVRLNHEAVAIADRQDALWRQSEARTTLAYSYYGAKQYERSRSIVADAVALSKQAQDWVSLARAYNGEGIAAEGLNDRPGERRAFEAAIECARRADSKIDEVRFLANLADFFLQASDYRTALGYAEQALPLARELRDRNSEGVALANRGLALISLHQVDAGMKNVRESMAIAERRGSLLEVAGLWREAGLYLERAGDLPGAVAAYQRHRRLITQILRVDQQKAILAMQEQYDADNRTGALTLLGHENALKAEALNRRRLHQRLWGLLAAAVLLSFAVVALLYRRVREANRLLVDSNERLRLQGERDPLTGLANRRHFHALMRQRAQDQDFRGTAFLIDIDHFKRINDGAGHGAGDAVLVEVSRRLRDTLRDEDVIVRWGGEEFVVVVADIGGDQVDALARRLLGALEDRPVAAGAARIEVTASIGFASFPIGPGGLRVTCERALDLVDAAMYLAKADGRNRAYGVGLAGAGDEAALDAVLAGLERAEREGHATLVRLQGRRTLAVAA